MGSSVIDLSNFRSEPQPKTQLAELCGTQQRFRDRYEVLKVLGRGGFGITFLAQDALLPGQPLCVIKQLCPKVSDPVALQRARDRFKQEAQALSKLGSHAHIPTLLDYFELEGEFYLVQEYIHGSTLNKEVKRSGPFSELAVKRFLREFLPLLQYVHNNRVIHRDIKPPNIIRCKQDGRLVLIDFGAVKEKIAECETLTSTKPTTTQFVGTVGFAPPEQLASRPVFASDIYAVGATCLYLLSGKSPLEFDYEFASGEVCWRDQIIVSDYFGTVLSKILRVTPQERFQSPTEVLRALDLEPYVDNLVYCMNVKPKPFQTATEAEPPDPSGYTPPIVRRAMAIRDWRAKVKARQVRYERQYPRLTDSGSGPESER